MGCTGLARDHSEFSGCEQINLEKGFLQLNPQSACLNPSCYNGSVGYSGWVWGLVRNGDTVCRALDPINSRTGSNHSRKAASLQACQFLAIPEASPLWPSDWHSCGTLLLDIETERH